MELYKKYRPKSLKQIVGQPETVDKLSGMMANNTIPHALLFTGPSGCGKTTLARILANHLECSEHDFKEVNCADFRGIDTVREIRSSMNQFPFSGKTRIWLIDESHKLSNDAQNAFLKLLEDTPNHVYFMLATPYPDKLIKEVKTRLSRFDVKAIADKSLINLVTIVAKKENLSISQAVLDRIVECSDCSARMALVILDQIRNFTSEESMIKAIPSIKEAEVEGIVLAKDMLYNTKTPWATVAGHIQAIEENQKTGVESLRCMLLTCAKKELLKLKGNHGRAYNIIKAFEKPFFDNGEWACFIAACYEIVVPE